MNYKKRLALGLFFLAIIVGLQFLNGKMFFTLQKLQGARLYMEQLVNQRYLLSVFLYLLAFISATMFGIPVTALLTIAAGYFFGVIPGTLYANIGATTGATILFLTMRYLLGSFVQDRCSVRLQNLNRNIKRNGASYLLSLQFLPFTPSPLINICAGLTQIRLWTFVWTTSVGILPGSLIYTFAGRQFAQMSSIWDLWSIKWIALLVLLAIFSLIPLLLSRRAEIRRFLSKK